MAKQKREKQSRFVDTIISLIFALLIGYGTISGFQTIKSEQTFLQNLLQFNDKYEWIVNAETHFQAITFILTMGMFVLMATLTRKKETGYKDASGHGAYGDAQFSNVSVLRDNGYIASRKNSRWSEKNALIALDASEGIILGRDGDELIIIPPDSKLDNRNVLGVGSSGSAKGQAFVINNIINNKSQTLVVTDPKGELFGMTADIKRDQGYRVYQIDFLNLTGNGYNPLDYVTSNIEAIKLANAISINSAKDVKQDFFFNTAKDLLTGLIIFVKEEYDNPNISHTVKGIFNQITESEDFLPELCETMGDKHPAYQYLKDASAQTGNTRASILSSFAQQTGVFSLKEVADLTEHSDFYFRDLQEYKSILYVKIPVKDNPVPALTATFFDQLITTLYQIGDENGAVLKIPTIFIFDEFANLGKLNDFDNTLSTCRGYDLSIQTIVQDFAQLEAKYGKELTRTIINNHDTTLFLRTKDVETAKYFERIAGNTTVKYNTKSSSNSGGLFYLLGLDKTSNSSRSTNEQYIQKPLVSEGELLTMNPSDKCYVFMTGHVIELKKAYQSLIYKDFITGVDRVLINGVMKFPYTYPGNREAYIKKFNLSPYEEVLVKSEEITETVESEKEIEPIKNLVEQKELVMNTIVDSFFEQTFTKKLKANTGSASDDSESTADSATTTAVTGGSVPSPETIQTIVDKLSIKSDPETLSQLREFSTIPERIDKTQKAMDEIANAVEIVTDHLNLSDEVKDTEKIVNSKEDDRDDLEELPMF